MLIHGSFDFALMFLAFLITLHDDESDNDAYVAHIEMISLLLPMSIVIGGIVLFFFESRRQKKRLDELENIRAGA